MRTAAALILLAATSQAVPQSGFQPGELVLYNLALSGGGSTDGGVVRIDPVSGQVSTIVLLPGSQGLNGSVCYDPYRDRVLFMGSWPTLGEPRRLWAADAAGNMTDLGQPGENLSCLTAGAGGRVYARGKSSATPIVYIDSANQLHALLDAGGTQVFQPPHWDFRGMVFHPGLNALFVATHSTSVWDCGPPGDVNLHRVRLSADGTRALAIDACASITVASGAGGVPVGLSLRPDGRILIVADTNSNAQQDRMQLVDPQTLGITPFAANGAYTGAAATNAGTWSDALGKAVIFDTFQDVLRAFGQSETGTGTVIVPSSVISAGGSSGEVATLIQVPIQPCSGTIGSYCTAKTTSGGCLPALSSLGCPSASAGAGFSVRASQVPASNLGLLLYSTSGSNAVPVLGGTLCVASPLVRTPAQAAGGAGVCGGQFAFDFNAWVPGSNDPALVAGAVVHAQFWFRDPPASFGVGLSGGVTFTLAP